MNGERLPPLAPAGPLAPSRVRPLHCRDVPPLLPALSATPDRPAVRLADASLTYRELERGARAHAGRMRSEGIRAGDRVAVWATAELATVAAVVGNALAGIATVPLNPALGEGELAHVLRGH